MKKLFEGFKRFLGYFIFASAALVVFLSIPKEGRFKYQYKKNDLWHNQDLISPFTFAVKKLPAEVELEKQEIKRNFRPYFILSDDVASNAINNLSLSDDFFLISLDSLDPARRNQILEKSGNLLKLVFLRGILDPNNQYNDRGDAFLINLLKGNNSEIFALGDFASLVKARNLVADMVRSDSFLRKVINVPKFLTLIQPNIFYNKELSDKKLNAELGEISLSKGTVNEGEKIIARGNVVSEEKFQILESLREEYETRLNSDQVNYYILAGYLLLILLIILGYAVYVREFNPQLMMSNKNVLMVMSTITLFIIISAYFIKSEILNVYLVPFCIVPILILTFFDSRVAFVSHLITVLIVSIFAPNSFEFLFIQIIAGLAIVIGISRVRYLSHFFITTLVVLFIYFITYLGIKLVQVNSYQEIDFTMLLWFSGNFLLTLLAYPMIYAYEKLFGILSDITLVELSDLNKKLLRELSVKAPGTFQHSIQVANLSEAVLNKIGGNSLLARVGSLYHDIGKMYAPQYFIENQKDVNPHDGLDNKESARIIINHVAKGVEYAREYHLPKEIIAFIKSHHGTSRVEYFYRNYMRKKDSAINVEKDFRYSGPKPSSKEMAVVMIADSVEAAARSMKEPTEETLEEMVDKLVDFKLGDNQFEMANISLKEIHIAKGVLKNNLKSIYHGRIEYPE